MIKDFKSMEKLYDKSLPIYFYCNIGARASLALSVLLKHGYKKLFNITGIIPLK